MYIDIEREREIRREREREMHLCMQVYFNIMCDV